MIYFLWNYFSHTSNRRLWLEAQTENQKNKTGVILGSGIGGLETIANTTELLNSKGQEKS